MKYDTPHLPAAVGVFGPSGAPKSDGGCGEDRNRGRPSRGSGSSILSLIHRCRTYGRTTLVLGVSDISGWWGVLWFPSSW